MTSSRGWHSVALVLVATCYFAGCASIPPSQEPPTVERPAPATLRVALFPYIPDSGGDKYSSLLRSIKAGFEKQYPTIELVLRPLDQSDDFYDFDTLSRWLTSKDQEAYDLVEVDTVILGDLVTAGLISAWPDPPGSSDWHPVANRSVRVNSPSVQEMLLTSGDVSATAVPRYLLPATLTAFDAPRVKGDYLYQQLKRAVRIADPFPNTGFLHSREALRDLLKSALEHGLPR